MGSGSAGTSSQTLLFFFFERARSHAHKPAQRQWEDRKSRRGELEGGGRGRAGGEAHQLTQKVRQPMLEMMSLRRW